MAEVVLYKGLTIVEGATGDGGEALTEDLKILVDRIEADSADLESHVVDAGNPHVVTTGQIGAATDSDLTTHTGNTSNPHSVTAAQAGASPAGHDHTESDISDLGNYLENVVEDVTPQLGGDLDIQANSIEGVNATRFGYLTTISSNVQDQIDGKSDTGHGHNEADIGDLGSYLENVAEDASPTLGGNLDVSTYNVGGVTPTEMGYVSGVTSSVQTQLNASSLTNGTRAFTAAVSGVTPSTTAQLATKGYVDSLVSGLDWQESVLDELTAPPGGESTGDRYLVISAATGAFSGKEDNIAEYNGAGWDFTAPSEGMAVWIEDTNVQKTYNGAIWVLFGSTVDHGSLIGLGDDDHTQYMKNLSEDVSPQLGANLDIQAFTIEGVNATRFGYLTTLSSNVQDQLDGKSDTGHGHNEADIGDLGSYLENVVEDASPQLGGDLDIQANSIEGVNATRFSYLTTLSSNVQTQLNAKATTASLSSHTGNTSNPHTVTAAQVGSPTTATFNSHTGNTSNPHSVTYTQAGAAADDHSHSYLANVLEDTTPQLGGDLDLLTRKIYTSTSNQDIIIQPNGTGAFQLSSTGNSRGTNAVDLQVNRAADTGVASGNYSVIGGGYDNLISGGYSTISGGQLNAIPTIGYGAISGGYGNTVSAQYGAIGGGQSNAVAATNGIISGGRSNQVAGQYGVIGGGYDNDISTGTAGVISGGQTNSIGVHNWGTIGGGRENDIDGVGQYSVICGGRGHTTGSTGSVTNYALIGGGYINTIYGGGQYCSILNGRQNVISSTGYSNAILTGRYNVTSSGAYSLSHGKSNLVEESYSVAFGQECRAFHSPGIIYSRNAYSAPGDNQTMVWHMSRRLASTGFIQLRYDIHGAASSLPKLEDGDTMAIRVLVVGARDASPYTYAAFDGTFSIQRQGIYSAVTVNGSGSAAYANVIYRPAATWDCRVLPLHDGSTYGYVGIEVKGPNTDIRWSARVDVALSNCKT